MNRFILQLVFCGLGIAMLMLMVPKKENSEVDPAICHGPALSVAEREQAMQDGFDIHMSYGCITKESYAAITAQQKSYEQAQAARLKEERAVLAQAGAGSFEQARLGFQTKLTFGTSEIPLPNPPSELFIRSDYKNNQNYALPGFLSKPESSAIRRPAIIWLTGGETNSVDQFWAPGPRENDQSASAFREAGVLLYFPVLRGGNGQGGAREWFMGEVDDVLAAAAQLAKLSYVDPNQIYLGGHSTGASLALLVAAMPNRFKAIFAFGPVASIDSYGQSLVPIDFTQYPAQELKLRSPLHWLSDIKTRTYIIEGEQDANVHDFMTLCAKPVSTVECISLPGHDHFSGLRPVSEIIAQQILVGELKLSERLLSADRLP
jgi:dipeptidyl aminopeptidase/acylaminoacyl peptidase